MNELDRSVNLCTEDDTLLLKDLQGGPNPWTDRQCSRFGALTLISTTTSRWKPRLTVSAEMEKLILNAHKVTGPGLRARSNSHSQTLWKEKLEKNGETTTVPEVCSGPGLCPGGRERTPSPPSTCYNQISCESMRPLYLSQEVKLLLIFGILRCLTI